MSPDSVEPSDDDALIGDYLARLRKAAWYLPRDRRDWVLAQVGDRIAEAIESQDPDDADIRDLLATLGEPRAVVRAVDGHVPGADALWIDVAAVMLLVVGGLAYLPAWVAGVVLLWASPRWRRADKVLGTVIWPGGLAAFKILLLQPYPIGPVGWYSSASVERGSFVVVANAHPIARWLILAALTVPPALVAIRLLRAAGRPAPPPASAPAPGQWSAGPGATAPTGEPGLS